MPNTLNQESLDFAKQHILDYYDTDFFPKSPDFVALWHKWDDLRQAIIQRTTEATSEAPPAVLAWPKPRGAYRIVHQPDPVDCLVYTAHAYLAGNAIEESRMPEGAGVACSYRIRMDDSGFFEQGSGFARYRQRCEALAQDHRFVLKTDIADFYNQIYLHRVQNAIAGATKDEALARSVEKHLSLMNAKASQGLPVGPAASIVFSEAAITDCDYLIRDKGFDHVRYVDDFRIFGDSQAELDELLQALSVYLYENHRLSLSSSKTKIELSSAFLKEELNNQYQTTKLEILEEIEVINPYTLQSEIQAELPDNADEVLVDAITRIAAFGELDLAVARAIIRRAKGSDIKTISGPLLKNFSFFRPVVNDLALYLMRVTDAEHADEIRPLLVELIAQRAISGRADQLWMGWFFAQNAQLLKNPTISAFTRESPFVTVQAQAAITSNNLAWIRERRTALLQHAGPARRALIRATQLMSTDERTALLNPMLRSDAATFTDKAVVRWALDGCPPYVEPAISWDGDDIPF